MADVNDTIQLFKHDQSVVSMPTVTEEEVQKQNEELDSQDITGAISGKKIKTLLLPEESIISEINYIFDFSEVANISPFKKEALKSLVVPKDKEDENTIVSLYLYKKNGLVEFGRGDRYVLERLMPLIKVHVFGDEIKIYKNFKRGKPLEEVSGRDITKLRLNL